MILELEKALNPGDLDPGKLYTHLHIEMLVYNSGGYALTASYGYGMLDSDGVYSKGSASNMQALTLTGDALDEVAKEQAKQGEPLVPGALRLGYEAIQKDLGIAGTLSYDLPKGGKA